MKVRTAIVIFISGMLFIGMLWQIEMLFVQFQNMEMWNLQNFTWPFLYEMPWSNARDCMYILLTTAFLLVCLEVILLSVGR